jgi:hypothetical protein
MRATIRFETDVDQVEGTMGMLVAQEAHNLRAVTDLLEDYIAPQDNVLEKVTAALGLLQKTMTQLEQYQQMLVSFERARFETMLPQPSLESDAPLEELRKETHETLNLVRNAEELREVTEQAEHFGNFIDKLNHFSEAQGGKPTSEEG